MASENSETSLSTPVQKEDGRGHLKIFFGAVPGVGKTHQMLDEALRRHSRGQDVVVGIIEVNGRKPIEELLSHFERIESLESESEGVKKRELNVVAIISRKPGLVIVDNLSHRNAKGSPHSFRWEDVYEILENGISVLTTLNVIDLESLTDTVADITGQRLKDTIPDHILHSADEIEMIDLTPKALMNRLERGDIFPTDKTDSLKSQYFDEAKLSGLRELALREAAGRVDDEVLSRSRHESHPWAVNDRIMICISPSQSSMRLIRRGWRMSQRLHGDIVAVYVEEKNINEQERRIVEEDRELATRLGIQVINLSGPIVEQLIDYARENAITQIVIGHSTRTSIQQRLRSSIITELIRELKSIDILVVSAEKMSN